MKSKDKWKDILSNSCVNVLKRCEIKLSYFNGIIAKKSLILCYIVVIALISQIMQIFLGSWKWLKFKFIYLFGRNKHVTIKLIV